MKIKLAILDSDQTYQNRIVSTFNIKYADKLEIYSFTDVQVALDTIKKSRINVLVASETVDLDVSAFPSNCAFAYFVNSSDIASYKEQPAICKYQKADLIYKQILSIYAEKAGSFSKLAFGEENTAVLAFTSPCGGTGTSTVAAACAVYYAKRGKKTLYLNLEKFGSADPFFAAEGQFNMSDVIFALKMKKSNLSMKLESCVKQDSRGVYFYSQPQYALDMCSLSGEDILTLISEIKVTGEYDYIILDVDFSLEKDTTEILQQAKTLVFVSDGSEISNLKIERAYTAMASMDEAQATSLSNRIVMIYNKFSNKIGKSLTLEGVKTLGGAPRYEHATTQQVLEQLSDNPLFDALS